MSEGNALNRMIEAAMRAVVESAERESAALDLLEAVDRAWREGDPPPVERIRACLVAAGRGASWE